jgi:hypothetical protein
MKKNNLPPFPKLSSSFTLEDIRKIRDYDYELSKILTPDELKAYLREQSDSFERLIEERRALGIKPIRPNRIAI